jgi:hypothetical protein
MLPYTSTSIKPFFYFLRNLLDHKKVIVAIGLLCYCPLHYSSIPIQPSQEEVINNRINNIASYNPLLAGKKQNKTYKKPGILKLFLTFLTPFFLISPTRAEDFTTKFNGLHPLCMASDTNSNIHIGGQEQLGDKPFVSSIDKNGQVYSQTSFSKLLNGKVEAMAIENNNMAIIGTHQKNNNADAETFLQQATISPTSNKVDFKKSYCNLKLIHPHDSLVLDNQTNTIFAAHIENLNKQLIAKISPSCTII